MVAEQLLPSSNTYPPYGFYILNRSGSSDFIQRIYPEDILSPVGNILGMKSYPSFTNKRMNDIRQSLDDAPLPGPFSEVYFIPNLAGLTVEARGENSLIGLWRHETGDREPMIEVLKRLHTYIKQNQPYPEEYRYGPGHPPPPHRLRAVNRPTSGISDSQTSSSCSDSDTGAPSDVDRLFAKFLPTAAPAAVASREPQNVTVESLFAKLSTNTGNGVVHSAPVTPAPASTGIQLLDSIFASASANNSQTSLVSPTPPPAAAAQIHSPTPTVSTSPPQQVLNQDVIFTLLGLPPSRAASAASTTHSSGARSNATSRDGDNEEDDLDSDSSGRGGSSSSSAQHESHHLLAVPTQAKNKLGRVKGDVTPRAFTTNGIPIKGQNLVPAPSVLEAASSISTVRGSSSSAHSSNLSTSTISGSPAPASGKVKPRKDRPLVPFEDDSELWPYTPSSNNGNNGGVDLEDGDIVELDFNDTSLLSDPEAFSKALKRNGHQQPSQPQHHLNGQNHGFEHHVSPPRKEKRNRRRSKKDAAKEREEIEMSWDVPDYCTSYVAQQRAEAEARRPLLESPPASPSPPPSPPTSTSASTSGRPQTPPTQSGQQHQQQQGGMDVQTPTMGGRQLTSGTVKVNGRSVLGVPTTPSSKGKKAAVNGVSGAATTTNGKVDPELVKSSLVRAIQPRGFGRLDRNDFVREVLTLIHTDKTFVDSLYQQYLSGLE
ncbi:hypothetical protein MD484_g1448, partial [Candolleomyces efflorescens]